MASNKSTADKPAAKMSQQVKSQRVARIIELREQGKAAYAEAEALEAGLLDRMGVGDTVKLPDGRVATMVDKFSDKNIVWCHASCRRFAIEVPK